MSDSFLVPSAKQILSYNEGDFFEDNIPNFYRLHTGRTFIWLEPSRNLYNLCVRGFYYAQWIPTKKVLVSYKSLDESIKGFFTLIRRLLNDLYK